MRFGSDTKRKGAAIAAFAVALSMGGQALALGCADIPGAKIDLGLDSLSSNQSYGRLYPEFKSNEKTEQIRRKLPIDRLVGKRLQIEGNSGHILLSLTQAGETLVTAVAGDNKAAKSIAAKLAGLDNAAYNGKLARTFFSLGIAWRDFAAPLIPAVDFEQVRAQSTVTSVAQTKLELKGASRIEREQKIEYTCSSDASFVGDPAKLSSMVVLKGTVRARQTTTTVTTDTVLDLIINDVVEQHTITPSAARELLGGHPVFADVLAAFETQNVATAPSAPAAEPAVPTKIEEQPAAAAVPVPAAPAEPPVAPTPDDGGSGFGWGGIWSALAALCAIILLFLYHPRFTASRGRASLFSGTKEVPESASGSAANEDAGERGTDVSKAEPEPAIVASRPQAAANDTAPPRPGTAEPAPKVQDIKSLLEPETRSATAAAEPEPEISTTDGTESKQDSGQSQPATGPTHSDGVNRSQEARIAVLETLKAEAEAFQAKLQAAIDKASNEAESSKEAQAKLAEAESRVAELLAVKAELQESAQNDRSKLNAVQEEARNFKEDVVDLKIRLAKANAQIEASASVIAELESASRMAIELNADYRSKTQDFTTENRALRSRVGLLEAALAERDELLQSTNQTNEEISRALLEERAERSAIEDDFTALSKDMETLQHTSSTAQQRAESEASQVVKELRATKELVSSLQAELEQANADNKQMQLDHHSRQSENARLRVDHGVRERLLENNIQELSAHVESLEARLREHDLNIPELQLTRAGPATEPPPEQPETKQPVRAGERPARRRGDILRFRARR